MTGAARTRRNLIEYVVFGLSLAIVLGSAGFLLYSGLTGPEGAAVLDREVRWREVQVNAGRYDTPIVVRNSGDRTVIDLQLEVIQEGAGSTFTVGFELPYLPHGSSRRLVASLPAPPQPDDVTVQVLGYRLE